MMSTPYQIKTIHALAAKASIDDGDYRALLSSFKTAAGVRVVSSKDLSVDQARELIKKLEYLAIAAGAYKKKRMRWDHLENRPGMATPNQLRHLEGLWVSVSRQPTLHEKQKSFNVFLDHRFGIARIEWIPFDMVPKIKRSLLAMKRQNDEKNNH